MWYVLILLIALSATFIIFLYVPYRTEIARAYEELEGIERRSVETDLGEIEYAVRGEGYPVMVIHGISGGHDQALGLAEEHLADSYMAILPSRFGYLGTLMPENASPASQADAFAALLDELGVEEAAVMAYSAGGASAIQFALRHPERISALVLVSTAPWAEESDKNISLPPEFIVRTVFGSDFIFWTMMTRLRRFTAPMIGVPREYERSEEEDDIVRDLMRSILPVGPRTAGAVFDMYVTNLDMAINRGLYPLDEISVPTLMINAVDDPFANYEYARKASEHIPNAKFVSIPQGGHVILGSGETVKSEIDLFLNRVILGEIAN